MTKIFNGFVATLLAITLVFGFISSAAWAEPSDSIDQIEESSSDISEAGAQDDNEESGLQASQSSSASSQDSQHNQASSSPDGNGSQQGITSDGGANDTNAIADSPAPNTLAAAESTEAETVQLDALAAQYKGSVEEGIYYIGSLLNQTKYIDVANASKNNGAAVQLYQMNMTAAQQWKISYDENGYATITNVASGKVLDVASGHLTNGTKVQQYASNGSRAQKWILVPNEEGNSFTILSALGNNIALDVTNASSSNGAKIQIYTSNGTNGQSWTFENANGSFDELDQRAQKSKGLLDEDDVYYIETALASDKVLDIASASTSNGANVQIYTLNRSDAQRFTVTYDDLGYATFANVNSGKVLDVKSASAVPGTNVQQYAGNDSRAQKWIVEQNDDGTYSISSALWPNLSLDVNGASSANGANIQIYRSNDSNAQKWNFIGEKELYKSLDERALASKGLLDESDSFFIETALASNKVVDVASASKNNKANVQLYTFNMTAAQQWRINYDNQGYVTFTNVNSGKVLDVNDAQAVSGANVQQYTGNDSRAQKWIVEQNDDGTYSISSALWENLSLDISGASTSNGANIQIYNSNGSNAQKWNFISERELYASLDQEAANNKDVLPDGTYVISSNTDNTKVIDVSNGSTSNGANVQMWESTMASQQQWKVIHDDKGYVTFISLNSNKALDVSGGAAVSGTNVQQYDYDPDARAQKWIIKQNDDGSYTIYSALWENLALDIQSGDPKNGSNVQIYTSNQTGAQKFVFFDTNPEVDPCTDFGFGDKYFNLATGLNKSYVVDILSASKTDGANVQLYTSNNSYAQLYTLKFVPDGLFSSTGYYQILCACSDMALAIDRGNVVNGANVVQHTANSNDESQLFSLRENSDGTYIFINKASGLALDVASENVANGTNLQGYTPNGKTKQKFSLDEVTNLLPEGYVVISSRLKSSMVVDVANASLSDGANVQLYTNNSTQAQKWYVSLTEEGSNTYTIQSINSGMNLATTSNGNVVQQTPNDSDNQKWQPRISKGSTILENVESGKVLDVVNAGTSNGTNVQTYVSNGTDAQLFDFSSTDLVTRSTYYIKPLVSQSVALDVVSGSTANGAKVQIYNKNDTGAQKWKVEKNSDGTYSIKNAQSNKALEMNGSTVQINSSNNSASQKWIFTYCVGGGISITSAANPEMALTVSGNGFASGASVGGAVNAESDSQKFVFEKTMYIPSNVPSNFRAMYTKAYSMASSTDWLIMIDRTNHLLGIFQGSKENWNLVKALSCTTGKLSTPTPVGITPITQKYYYHSQSYYRSVFYYGMYGIHSVIRSDSELGKSISNGCVRISRNEAIWVYNNIPLGTIVCVY